MTPEERRMLVTKLCSLRLEAEVADRAFDHHLREMESAPDHFSRQHARDKGAHYKRRAHLLLDEAAAVALKLVGGGEP